MDVLKIIKLKLSTPLPTDEQLEALIKEVEQSILNFCNIRKIPEALYYTQANMVIDLLNHYKRNGLSENDSNEKSVTSIKEGDVTVHFSGESIAVSERNMESILFDYHQQLKTFRRLRW